MKAWHAVLAGLLAFVPPASQAAEDANGAARELAAKAVAFAGAGTAFSLSYRNLSSLGPAEFSQSRAALETALREAGGRIAENGAVELRITASENATDYLLVAEARHGDDRQVWMAAWKRTAPLSRAGPGVSLDRKLVWEQDEQILDIAFPAGAMLVLSPSRLTLYLRPDSQWVARQSLPLSPTRPWPRDLRGHLRVQGASFQAFLPDMTCNGTANSALTMECRAADEAWVLESGSRALLLAGFAAARNYFDGRVVTQTGAQRTVPPFYSAAAVEDRGQTLWLLALTDGRTQLFDAALNPVTGAVALPAWGSDLAAIDARCGPPSQILATRAGERTEPDAVQSFAIAERSAAPLTADLVAQFRRSFARRREDIAQAVNRIAASDALVNISIAPDYSPYYGEAASLAAAHSLDLLELVAADGSIISSAEWPARFGYREDWLTTAADWNSRGAFLRREELPDGFTLALVAVGVVNAGDRRLYVVGGEQLDRAFLSALLLPAGMSVLLYRNLEPQFSPVNLIDASGPVAKPEPFRPLIEQVERTRREADRTLGSGADSDSVHALPLTGAENNLLGVLLIASSRKGLAALESSLYSTGIAVAAGGILMGVLLSAWATARVTRPVRRLAETAGRVAAGDWNATVDVSSGDEIGLLATAFNRMTHELVEQRERLVQTERVAAWRELARRLAHELKNPLFPLQITVENMQRARERYPEQFDEAFREGTHTLLAELANLKQIIGRFSDFAKMPAPEMQPVDFNCLLGENLKLFEARFTQAGVTPRLELDPRLPKVPADPEQMSRALRNLVLNAIDAMPHGGTLTVRTIAAGSAVRIEVQDTGQGLTPEECARLFTPYYTTKTHGTGLGLAIVQSVVSDHHGRISVDSEPGKGATFRIDLG